MRSRIPHATRIAVLLLPVVATLACNPLRLPFLGSRPYGSTMTEEELQNELAGYAVRFGAIVRNAAEDIMVATDQRSIRRRTLLWRMKMIPPVQTAAFLESPKEGYLRLLGIAMAQTLYLREGDGRELFGANQSIAINAAIQLQDDAVQVGRSFLTPERQARVMAEVEAIVAKYPITGREFSLQRVVDARAKIKSSESLMAVLTLPLAPFRALEGVDNGAEAIRDFNQTARQVSVIVSQLPEEMRTQMELLLYDLEDRETLGQALAAIESMSASARSASESIERLPADIQTSLTASQGALKEVNQALLTAREVLGPLAQATENVKLAGDAWAPIFADDQVGEPKGRPFDVLDWKATVAEIGTSAAELRALAGEIRLLTSGGNPLDAAVDHATWRGAQLVALFFALLVAYRLFTARLDRARRGA